MVHVLNSQNVRAPFFTKKKQMKKNTSLLFVALFIGCVIILSSCNELINKAKQLIPDAGSQYNAAEELRRAQGDTTVPQRPYIPKTENETDYGKYVVKWEVTPNAIKWTAYDGNTKKAEDSINLDENPTKIKVLISDVNGIKTVNVDELIKEVQKLIPDPGPQFNAAEELRWAQGKSDKIPPYAPKGIKTPNKVCKGCYYTLGWDRAPNAIHYCVNWSFYDKSGKKLDDKTRDWTDKLEDSWTILNQEGIMKVKIFAKNSGGQSQESPTIDINVVTTDKKNVECLSYEDYLSVFSNPSTYNKKFAYWCINASNDAYKDFTNNAAMGEMGFINNESIPIPFFSIGKLEIPDLKFFIGYQKLEKEINNISNVVMISIRGSNKPMNYISDISAAPVDWKTGLPSTIGNQIIDGVIELIDNIPEAHGGFYTCMIRIWEKIKTNSTYSKYINKYKGNTLFIITGHSLGGAIAELLSLKLKENDVPSNNIICYGFASPPVGDKDLYHFANGKFGGKSGILSNQIHKIMNTRDPIPKAGFYAYTLACKPYEFTYDASSFWQEHWILSKEQAGHNCDLVYLNHILGTLEKVYCVK